VSSLVTPVDGIRNGTRASHLQKREEAKAFSFWRRVALQGGCVRVGHEIRYFPIPVPKEA